MPITDIAPVVCGEAEPREALSHLVQLYSKSITWLVNLVAHKQSGSQRFPFELDSRDISLLEIPITSILMEISHNTKTGSVHRAPCDFWDRSIARYAYRDCEGSLHFAEPGYLPGNFHAVERLLLEPHAEAIPFLDIVRAIQVVAGAMRADPSDYYFHFEDYAINSSTWFSTLAEMSGKPFSRIYQDIQTWREDRLASLRVGALDWSDEEEEEGEELDLQPPSMAEGRGPGFIIDFSDPQYRAQEPFLDAIRECADKGNPETLVEGHEVFLSRTALAKILCRNRRTLIRWDEKGHAPGGRSWAPPARTKGGLAFYNVKQNWNAICSLRKQPRDDRRDALAAIELGKVAPKFKPFAEQIDVE